MFVGRVLGLDVYKGGGSPRGMLLLQREVLI